MVDSIMLDEAGGYLFNGLNPGNYAIQAVADKTLYPNAVPTYFGGQLEWSSAQFNDFNADTKVNFLNIVIDEVPKLTAADGSGTASGNLIYEETGVLKSTKAQPVKRGPVILSRRVKKSTEDTEVVAYIETDISGHFIFENIPNGDYLLLVDIPGLGMLETHEITIQGAQIVGGLDYTVGDDGIYTWTGVGVQNLVVDPIKLFPNPGNGLVQLEFPTSGDYSIQIYAADGRLIYSREYQNATGNRILDLSEQHEGVYLIKVAGPTLSTTTKYLKW